MQSFSYKAKAELCRGTVQRLCCARAECYGALLYCNTFTMQEVRIIYRDIGVVDSTMSAEDAESAEVHFIPSLEMVVQQMAAQTQVS